MSENPGNEPVDMSEFEAEVSDVVDPHPLEFAPIEDDEKAHKVSSLVADLTSIICGDLVAAMNNRRPALCQYLWPDGTALTAILSSHRTMVLTIQHPGDKTWIRFGDADGEA